MTGKKKGDTTVKGFKLEEKSGRNPFLKNKIESKWYGTYTRKKGTKVYKIHFTGRYRDKRSFKLFSGEFFKFCGECGVSECGEMVENKFDGVRSCSPVLFGYLKQNLFE